MERFSWTLEGLGHGGRYRQITDGDRFWISQQNSADELPDYEREDTDYAIALSLSEEDQKQKNFIVDEYQSKYKKTSVAQPEMDKLCAKAQLVEDELLAIALQQSLIVEDRSRHSNANSLQLHPVSSSGSRICAGCKNQIGHEDSKNCMGADWHPKCFRCHACGLPIADLKFSMSRDHPYHESCYRANHHPRCYVCQNCLPLNKGLVEFKVHPFWLRMYCPSHERDGTPRCCSCERITPRDRLDSLKDGRKLCPECLDSVIMDTNACQPLYLEIQAFYERMNMKVDQQIPLSLVAREALNEAMEGETNGHHHSHETRGLCIREEQSVPTVARRPRIGASNQFTDMQISAILLYDHHVVADYYRENRLLTGSNLAHEMMHAWLRLEGCPILSPEVEEGICQVLAHTWLNSEIYSSSSNVVSSSSLPSASSSSTMSKKGKYSDFEVRLGEYFKHQIETEPSMAYGEGFKLGNKAVKKHGLRNTLDYILLTGTYPL